MPLKNVLHRFVFTALVLPLVVACGQNAHVTAPTPKTDLKKTYSGNDIYNGNYEIDIGASNDTGQAFTGKEDVTLTLDSPDGTKLFYRGHFKMGTNLLTQDPIVTDAKSLQTWDQIRSALKEGYVEANGRIIFDKRKWALNGGDDAYFYRLFDANHIMVPESDRHEAQALRLTLNIRNQYGLAKSSEVLMPVRYRYAFDDEAFGPARLDRAGGATYPSGRAPTTRVIAGLESTTNHALTSPDTGCEATFGLNYPFDFIDMHDEYHPYAATATALRAPDGTWTPVSVARPTLLGAIGSALGGSIAAFTNPPDYEGLCYRKVYGFVLTDRFIDLDLSGIRLSVSDDQQAGVVVYGLTKAEAF